MSKPNKFEDIKQQLNLFMPVFTVEDFGKKYMIKVNIDKYVLTSIRNSIKEMNKSIEEGEALSFQHAQTCSRMILDFEEDINLYKKKLSNAIAEFNTLNPEHKIYFHKESGYIIMSMFDHTEINYDKYAEAISLFSAFVKYNGK
jgi:hypothetical protein